MFFLFPFAFQLFFEIAGRKRQGTWRGEILSLIQIRFNVAESAENSACLSIRFHYARPEFILTHIEG
jgi:hypothetical protein